MDLTVYSLVERVSGHWDFKCWIKNQFRLQIKSLNLSVILIIHIKKEKRQYLHHQSVNLLPNFDIMLSKQYITTSYSQMRLLTLFAFSVKIMK